MVVARHPEAGHVKSRLAASVGPALAADIYKALLADTLTRAAAVPGAQPVVAWAAPRSPGGCTPGAPEPAHDPEPGASHPPAAGLRSPVPLPSEFASRTQRGDGLGERLANLLADLFDEGASAVAIVGSDSPSLPGVFFEEAIRRLREQEDDLVIGPAADGGFYLIGAVRRAWASNGKRLRATLERMPAGTAGALDHLTRAAEEGGLRVARLPMWIDVDTAEDLALAGRLNAEIGRLAGGGGMRPAPSSTATNPPGPAAVSDDRPHESPRGGSLETLHELYLHMTDRCAVGCPHCYASGMSARTGQGTTLPELTTAQWLGVVDQGRALGAKSFVMIGGDPFQRVDLIPLISSICGERGCNVRLFFGRALDQAHADALASVGRGRLTPLLSVDGMSASHDALRGPGTFERALETARVLLSSGLDPVVNTVLLRPVLADLPALIKVLGTSGVRSIHLVLPHSRGGLSRRPDLVPTGDELLAAVDEATSVAENAGVTIDNHAAWTGRLRAPRDLCSAGCTLLAVDPYGRVSACPITCGDEAFVAGDLSRQSLEDIWKRSPVLDLLRHSHARDRPECRSCPVVDACGGECWVQAHYAAVSEGRPAGYAAGFPFCDLVRPLFSRRAKSGQGDATHGGPGCGLGGPAEAPLKPAPSSFAAATPSPELASPTAAARPKTRPVPFDCI